MKHFIKIILKVLLIRGDCKHNNILTTCCKHEKCCKCSIFIVISAFLIVFILQNHIPSLFFVSEGNRKEKVILKENNASL